MTKPRKVSTPLEDLMKGAASLPDASARFEAFWRAQAAAAAHVQSYVDAWCERRRDAAQAAADCCAQMLKDGGDAAAATGALTDFAAGAAQRLREDASGHVKLMTDLTGDAMSAVSVSKPNESDEPKAPKSGRGANVDSASTDVR